MMRQTPAGNNKRANGRRRRQNTKIQAKEASAPAQWRKNQLVRSNKDQETEKNDSFKSKIKIICSPLNLSLTTRIIINKTNNEQASAGGSLASELARERKRDQLASELVVARSSR